MLFTQLFESDFNKKTAVESVGDDYEDCSFCSGTGEGRWEGTSCTHCKGTGVEPVSRDNDDYDDVDDYDDDYQEPESHYEKYVRINKLEEQPGAGNIGRQIKALYQKIYDQGDDAVEFMYYDSPIFAQYWDEYEGDLDSIIAEVDPQELQIILDELESAVEDQGLTEAAVGDPYAFGDDDYMDLIQDMIDNNRRNMSPSRKPRVLAATKRYIEQNGGVFDLDVFEYAYDQIVEFSRGMDESQGVAEGSETAADIDKKIEFHKQGQAAAQYKGSMNKMHAAKIRELEAKKQALKQGVAEGHDEHGFHTALEKGKFLPSKFGNKQYVYLHDLENQSPSTGGPQLVTVDDAGSAKQLANQFGGKVVKTKLGTFRIVKPVEQGVAEANKKKDEPEVKDVALQRAISNAKVAFPAAGTGIEALAKDFMRSQEQDQKSFDQIRQAERKQDQMLSQISKIDQEQEQEIKDLENQNSTLSRRLQQLQSVNNDLEKKLAAMSGRKQKRKSDYDTSVGSTTSTSTVPPTVNPPAAKPGRDADEPTTSPAIGRMAQDLTAEPSKSKALGQMTKALTKAPSTAIDQMAQQLQPRQKELPLDEPVTLKPKKFDTSRASDADYRELTRKLAKDIVSDPERAMKVFTPGSTKSVAAQQEMPVESKKKPEPPEVDYDDPAWDAMVRRVGQLAKQGPRKTVWDPVKRVYKTVPVNPVNK